MAEDKQVKFVRLRSAEEDIVGYVTFKDDYITIEKPLYVMLETIVDEGRQILSLHEYLPQSIVKIQEVDFLNADVLFTTPVKEDFLDQYQMACDYYYSPEVKLKPSKKSKKKAKEIIDDLSEEQKENLEDNVVSIMQAIIDKRNKPVH